MSIFCALGFFMTHNVNENLKTDLDDEIADLENAILAEQMKQETLVKQQEFFSLACLRDIIDSKQVEFSSEISAQENKLAELRLHVAKQQEMCEQKEKELQVLRQEKKTFEEHYLVEQKLTQTQIFKLNDYYQTIMSLDFSKINIELLQMIQKLTTQHELFFAVSIRLGLIYFYQKKHVEALKCLCYIPKTVLNHYQIINLVHSIFKKILNEIPGIHTSQYYFENAENPEFSHFSEFFLWLSIMIQMTPNPAPYLKLLDIYLQNEEWLKVMIIWDILKETYESQVPIERLQRKIQSCSLKYKQDPNPEHLLQHQKFLFFPALKSCLGKKSSLTFSALHQSLLEHPEAQSLQKTLSFFNHDSDSNEILEPDFLSQWRDYQIGLRFLKNKQTQLAIDKFIQIIQINPFFIEVKIQLESLTPEFNWCEYYFKGETVYEI